MIEPAFEATVQALQDGLPQASQDLNRFASRSAFIHGKNWYNKGMMRFIYPAVLLLALSACDKAKSESSPRADLDEPPATLEEKSLPVKFEPYLEGATKVTDIQFVSTDETIMVVLRQTGEALWHSMDQELTRPFLQIAVESVSELGLLGIAFHPRFQSNGRFFLHYTPRGDTLISRVAEWSLPGGDFYKGTPTETAVLLEVEQPFPNHNGGQIQFGPDGFLYIALGDGGAGGDPLDHGQNLSTLLGSILRIDVDSPGGSKPYAIPDDNPFVGREGAAPEIYAYGLRNPWRFSFDKLGRLWTGDVGQNKWEEISIIESGENYGWNFKEATHCFEPPQDCEQAAKDAGKTLVEPVYEYDHSTGYSVTGGYTYEGTQIPELKGAYVFGDLNGSVWALHVPDGSPRPDVLFDLGSMPGMPTTFGRSPDGELWVGDYNSGQIFRIRPR